MIVVWQTSRGDYGWASLQRKRDEKRIDRIRSKHEIKKVYCNWQQFHQSNTWNKIKQQQTK